VEPQWAPTAVGDYLSLALLRMTRRGYPAYAHSRDLFSGVATSSLTVVGLCGDHATGGGR
jgi:hypothetical protein